MAQISKKLRGCHTLEVLDKVINRIFRGMKQQFLGILKFHILFYHNQNLDPNKPTQLIRNTPRSPPPLPISPPLLFPKLYSLMVATRLKISSRSITPKLIRLIVSGK